MPIWRMVSMPLDEVGRRGNRWAKVMNDLAVVVEGESMLGGGSLPGSALPTMLVAVGTKGSRKDGSIAQLLSEKLRQHEPPIIGRIGGDMFFLDPRSVLPEEDDIVFKALKEAAISLK